MKKNIKIITIVGARPQFVKAAALSRVFDDFSEIQEIIIHTGQHFDQNMSEVFFEEMGIPIPQYNLKINNLSHGAMTGRMIEGIESVLLKEQPDLVVVYGDTNSTLAGAIAAKKLNIKIAHIEAGLRSFNMRMPEEVNRVLTDHISDFLFCPTSIAVNNLKNEGIENENLNVLNTGDVMYDAAIHYSNKSLLKSKIIEKLGLSSFILCTIHRAENINDLKRFTLIINALNDISEDRLIVCPLHPGTRNKIEAMNLKLNFKVINPVGYFDMIELLKNCDLVVTDSGGIQKEAYFFRRNCVTLRNETEWVELLDQGVNRLAGNSEREIADSIDIMLNKESNFETNLYGNGNSCQIICNHLLKNL